MSNVVLVSGVQQSDSVIHICVPILFQVLFPFRLLQNTKRSSLYYTVGLVGYPLGFPGGSDGKVCLQCRRRGFDPWVKIPWRRKWKPTPLF